jgi:regulatory protein
VDTVTTITAARGGGLLSVALDSGERFLITASSLSDLRIAAGDELDGDAVAALRSAERADRAHGRLLRLLSTRARSRAELERRLAGWDVDPEAAAGILGRLERAGLLDDDRFAGELSAGLQRRGQGSRRTEHDLERLGVAEAARAGAVADHAQADPEIAGALLAARFGPPPYDRATTARAASFLARRGIAEEAAWAVLGVDPDLA